jgi:hypothetical protein
LRGLLRYRLRAHFPPPTTILPKPLILHHTMSVAFLQIIFEYLHNGQLLYDEFTSELELLLEGEDE